MPLTHSQPVSYRSIMITGLLFLFASALSHQSGLDLWLANSIYQLEGGNNGKFPWTDNYWLSQILHDNGRRLVGSMFFITLATFIATWFVDKLRPYRSGLLFILLAIFWSTALIAELKRLNNISCPNALQMFGGDRQWISFWQLFSADLPVGKCYPAGHASGGYAWLAIVFLAPTGSHKAFWYAIPGLMLGMTLGIAQQLRGQHFFSHDLATIGFCWLISGSLYHLMRHIYLRFRQTSGDATLACSRN